LPKAVSGSGSSTLSGASGPATSRTNQPGASTGERARLDAITVSSRRLRRVTKSRRSPSKRLTISVRYCSGRGDLTAANMARCSATLPATMAASSSLATLWRACQVVISPPSVRLARRMTVIAPISRSLSDMAVSENLPA
jgi:hypothetical protein